MKKKAVKMKSVKEFDELFLKYIKKCKKEEKNTSYLGLANFIGFKTSKELDLYIKKKEFSHSIKRAKKIVLLNVGRPRKYKDPIDLLIAAEEYFEECEKKYIPLTYSKTALALGFTERNGLDHYAKQPGFESVVKKIKLTVEASYESVLYEGKPTGAIFALKNYGWKEKKELDHTSSDGTMSPKEMTDEQLREELEKLGIKSDEI